MGLLEEAGTKAVGAVVERSFSRKFTRWFRKNLPSDQVLKPNELINIMKDLQGEIKDNENFRLQAGKLGVTKHQAALSLYKAFHKIEKCMGKDLVLPEKAASADKAWAELTIQFKIIEENIPAFFLSINAFITAFQLETRNLNIEKQEVEKVESEVGKHQQELRIIEKSLSLNGVFDQLLARLKSMGEEAKKCEQIGLTHVSADAQEKILNARPLIPLSINFLEVVQEEKKALKSIQRFFGRYHHQISNFEVKAEVLSKAISLNRKAAMAYAGDYVLSYLTLGNLLTGLTLASLVLAPEGYVGFAAARIFGSRILRLFKPALPIVRVGTHQSVAWISALFKPTQAVLTSFGTKTSKIGAETQATARKIGA